MRAVEFKSKIRENKILIPRRMQSELIAGVDRTVRVVVFVEDTEVYDAKAYRQMTKNQFLNGYADSDSIYDV
jgi:hypothetical protein